MRLRPVVLPLIVLAAQMDPKAPASPRDSVITTIAGANINVMPTTVGITQKQ